MKVPIISTKDFTIYLEEYLEHTFIHCDVFSKWSKAVKNKLQEAFNLLTKEYGEELYALCYIMKA